jgi:phosphate/phosphite/phosphonate ABC transporter binding protein
MHPRKKVFVIVSLAVIGLIIFLIYSGNINLMDLRVFNKPERFTLKKFPQPTGANTRHKAEIKMSGSEPVVQLMRALATEFEREYENIKIIFPPATHSREGILGVLKKEYDFGLVSRELSPEEAKHGFHYIHFADDPLAFVVHKNVKVKNLTSEQIKQIYSGQITNWQQVDGGDRPIVVLDRPEHTSPKIILRKQLFGDDLKIVDNAVILERPGQMVQSLKLVENSIGYASLRDVISFKKELNILRVDNVLPTTNNVDGDYPYFRPFALLLGTNPRRPMMKFLHYVFSDRGKMIVEDNSCSPELANLIIGVVPEQDLLSQESRYRPLVEYLSDKLKTKLKIKLKHLSSYQDVVRGFISGKINAAFFGSMTYVLTNARVDTQILGRPETDGVSEYRGLIFTRKDSGIKGVRDLKGKNFSMVRATTAADIFPKIYFKDHGVLNMERYLGRIYWVDSHETSINMIAEGKVQAGAAKDLVYYRMLQKNPKLKSDLIILARSAPVPDNALIVYKYINNVCYDCHHKKFAATQEATDIRTGIELGLKDALLELNKTAEGKEVLAKMGVNRFIETTDADYQNLYDMFNKLGVDPKVYPIDQ